jgi:hypothetical protein
MCLLHINIAQDKDRQGEERINEEWGVKGCMIGKCMRGV